MTFYGEMVADFQEKMDGHVKHWMDRARSAKRRGMLLHMRDCVDHARKAHAVRRLYPMIYSKYPRAAA